MTLPEALQAYARALVMRHRAQFLRFRVVSAANDNGVR
jgi:hypothetical protein